MGPEKLVRELEKATVSGLTSVVLYGSAVAGDYLARGSNYNILVVTRQLDTNELLAFSKPSLAWVRAGNPPPLLFTLERLRKSCDVFPIEILDIQESHRTLFGTDVVSNLKVNQENLRLQLEHELKGKLIQLRERFLLSRGKKQRVLRLISESLSPILVLFRAALRLYQARVPQQKMEALQGLSKYIDFDCDLFTTLWEIKEDPGKSKPVEPITLFDRYLKTLETVVDAVDVHIHKTELGE